MSGPGQTIVVSAPLAWLLLLAMVLGLIDIAAFVLRVVSEIVRGMRR